MPKNRQKRDAGEEHRPQSEGDGRARFEPFCRSRDGELDQHIREYRRRNTQQIDVQCANEPRHRDGAEHDAQTHHPCAVDHAFALEHPDEIVVRPLETGCDRH